MTTLEPKTLKAIEAEMDELVEMAERTVDETNIANSRLEEHQLRNLENMANATDSVKALELFVRYQMGRHPEWRYNKFGERVLEDFGELEEKAKKLAKELAQQGQEKSVHLHLIRLYLGFLTRAFVARRPRGE